MQNLSCNTLCPLSLFTSKRKKRIISLNMLLDRVLLNIGQHQVVSYKLSTDRPLNPKIPPAITNPINLSSSSSVTSQFILPETQRASVTVNFLMFLTIASSNKTRKDDSGLLLMIPLVANAVGPGLKLNMFCCFKRPRCTWKWPKLVKLFRLLQ